MFAIQRSNLRKVPPKSRAESRKPKAESLFVAPLRRMDLVECERLFVEDRLASYTSEFPRRNVAELVIVASRFVVGCLKLLAEMSSAGLFPVQGITSQQFRKLHVV